MVNAARFRIGVILLAVSHTAYAEPGTPADYSALTRSIDEAVVKKGLPSVVAIIFDDHRILWSRGAGYSDVASKTAPSLRTRYRLGSMAKAVTSTVLIIAEQRGMLSFDSKVPVRTSQGFRRTSLRELVNMQAGLAQAVCYDGITDDADADCGAGFIEKFTVSMTDGAGRYSYSNVGPQRAADALAHRLNKPFDHVAHDLLFLPAGISGMTYDHKRDAVSRATSYDRNGKAYEHDFRILPAGGAGLEASGEDLVRFGQLHLTGRGPDGRQILPTTSLAQLHSAPNGGFYGYGWGRIGGGTPDELLISDGQVNGGQAMLLINPFRRVGAVVLSNAAHDEISQLALKAIDTAIPGIAASFEANLQRAQAAHQTKASTFLPPPEFQGEGSIVIDSGRLRIEARAHENRLTATIGGRDVEQPQFEQDEGFKGWGVPCPSEIPACRRPGATAKLWLSSDSGGLAGQLQITSSNGQLPFPVRMSLDSN